MGPCNKCARSAHSAPSSLHKAQKPRPDASGSRAVLLSIGRPLGRFSAIKPPQVHTNGRSTVGLTFMIDSARAPCVGNLHYHAQGFRGGFMRACRLRSSVLLRGNPLILPPPRTVCPHIQHNTTVFCAFHWRRTLSSCTWHATVHGQRHRQRGCDALCLPELASAKNENHGYN